MSQSSDLDAKVIRAESGGIVNSFIVLLKQECDQSRHFKFLEEKCPTSCKLTHKYEVFKGYSAILQQDALDLVSKSGHAELIVQDTMAGCEVGIPGNDESEEDDGEEGYVSEDVQSAAMGSTLNLREQRDAPWGLQRISQRNRLPKGSRPRDLNFTFRYRWLQNPEPVDVYVLSTGVNIQHKAFGDRARWGENYTRTQNRDSVGHGTHLAGTIAGKRWGIARQANIISVKVIGDHGRGSSCDIISGIDWSVKNAELTGRPSVINLSLISRPNCLLKRAAVSAVERGIHVCAAAGNHNIPANHWSPADEVQVITVGASTIEDTRRFDSNFGQLVNIFAPGCDIYSAGIHSRTAHKKRSGTSMATAYVAGMIAYLIQLEGNRHPARMLARLQELGLHNKLDNIPKDSDTPNLLLCKSTSQ